MRLPVCLHINRFRTHRWPLLVFALLVVLAKPTAHYRSPASVAELQRLSVCLRCARPVAVCLAAVDDALQMSGETAQVPRRCLACVFQAALEGARLRYAGALETAVLQGPGGRLEPQTRRPHAARVRGPPPPFPRARS